jgi:hypothetical protein
MLLHGSCSSRAAAGAPARKKSTGSTDAILKELRAFGLTYPGVETKSPWPLLNAATDYMNLLQTRAMHISRSGVAGSANR